MPVPEQRPEGRPQAEAWPSPAGGSYSLHPLPALDGMFIYVTLNGEAVGSYFGPTEQAATAAAADDLVKRAPRSDELSA